MEPDSTPQMARHEILELAGAVLGGVTELAKRLPRNGHSLPSHYSILCYSTMLQDAAACFILMQNSFWGSVQKLLRPIIESYMHLKSITNDTGYINEVILGACRSLERYVEPHEKRLVSPEFAMSDSEIAKCRDTISGYKGMATPGFVRKKTLDQYKCAGIESFYVYSHSKYSRSIHGNLLALLDCHTTGETCLNVVTTKDISCLEFNTIVGEFVHMLHDATDIIVSHCGVNFDEELEKCRQLSAACTSRIMVELRKQMKAPEC